jgi:hypothetical protein
LTKSAAKLKQFHEFGVDMDQKEEVGKGVTTPLTIPDLKIDIDQERSKGRLRFGRDYIWDDQEQFLKNFESQLEKVENQVKKEALKNLLIDMNHTFHNIDKSHFF